MNRERNERNEITCDPYLLFPCEKATIVPELASSCRRAAAIVNSGTCRSSVAARSKLASFSRSSLSSPEVVKVNHSCHPLCHFVISLLITAAMYPVSTRYCNARIIKGTVISFRSPCDNRGLICDFNSRKFRKCKRGSLILIV